MKKLTNEAVQDDLVKITAYLQKTGTKRIVRMLRKEPKSLLEDDFSPLYYMWLGGTVRGAYKYASKGTLQWHYLDFLEHYHSTHEDIPARLRECYRQKTLPEGIKPVGIKLAIYTRWLEFQYQLFHPRGMPAQRL